MPERRDAVPLAPLRVLIAAFAARALIAVVQTALYQAVAYDSPANGAIGIAVGVAYVLADLALLFGLLRLGNASPGLRAVGRAGAALCAFAVLAGLLGLALRAAGSVTEARAFVGTVEAAEPPVSAGASLLGLWELVVLARARGFRGAPAVATCFVLAIL